jgi:hypothetical protein
MRGHGGTSIKAVLFLAYCDLGTVQFFFGSKAGNDWAKLDNYVLSH